MEARPEDFVAPAERSVVDAAIYREGRRVANRPRELENA